MLAPVVAFNSPKGLESLEGWDDPCFQDKLLQRKETVTEDAHSAICTGK